MNSHNDTDALPAVDAAELAILIELRSPEAVAAFDQMHTSIRPRTAQRFADLLSSINRLSGPDFAVNASLELLDAVDDSGDLDLVEQFAPVIADPLGALSLAQLLRTCRDSEQ